MSIRIFKSVLIPLIIVVIAEIYYGPAAPAESKTWTNSVVIHYVLFPIILIGLFVTLIFTRKIHGVVNTYLEGKIRGLWLGPSLQKQVEKNYLKSETVNIKLTKGHSTFCESNGNFFEIFSQKFMDKIPSNNGRSNVNVLLLFPCHHSHPIDDRTKNAEGESDKKPLDTSIYRNHIYDTIFKIEELKLKYSDKVNFTTRLYGDTHHEWRYYLFEHKKKVLFLNHYLPEKKGSKTPMMEIHNGKSLCDDFDRKFHKVFHDDSISVDEITSHKKIKGCPRSSKECQGCIKSYTEIVQPNLDRINTSN